MRVTRRALIAAAWIAGTTVPLLLSTVLLFGCCVLPFHSVIHRLMPFCQTAMGVLRGEHDQAPTPAPARAKQERVPTELPQAARIAISAEAHAVTPAAATMYRSFITLGAMRCDRDVGLHVLLDLFLI